MSCIKCTKKFNLFTTPSKLYFVSEYDELIRKTYIFFKKLGLDITINDDSIYGYETLTRGVKANGDLMYPNELFEKSKRNN